MPTVTTAETGLLTPHMPRLVLRWLNEEPERTARSIDGTVVFVDISGFTALSERLARNGRVGAEEITEILGQLFTRLLAVAYGNGGMLIKFGGDALLLLFEGDDHAGVAHGPPTACAASCARWDRCPARQAPCACGCRWASTPVGSTCSWSAARTGS